MKICSENHDEIVHEERGCLPPPGAAQIIRSLEEEREILQWTVYQRNLEIDRLEAKCAAHKIAQINVAVWGRRKKRQARDFLEMFLNGRR